MEICIIYLLVDFEVLIIFEFYNFYSKFET